MSAWQLALAIALMTLATQITRFFPFLVFGRGRKPSATVLYLGRALPPAMLSLLVVYCLKGVRVGAYPHGLPELIACATVAVLQLWKRNYLLSIFAGTALYMALVQFVFV